MQERERSVMSGWGPLILLLVLFCLCIATMIVGPLLLRIAAVVVAVIDLFLLMGLFFINPNEARVLQLFGKYVGTAKAEGLRWANPLYTKKRISLRVRNFETGRMKVNDVGGNPVEIAAIVVWKVVDTAEACFHVDNYEEFVKIQSEAAVRNLATQHPYDAHSEDITSLRGNTAEISEQLKICSYNRVLV